MRQQPTNCSPSDDFNAAKEDTENRMKERLNSRIEQRLDITDENVNHESQGQGCNVPW